MQEEEYKDTEYVYGIRAIMEAIENGKEVETVLIRENTHGPLMGELRKLLKSKAIPSKILPTKAFQRFKDQNHQGVLAALSPIQYDNLEWLLPGLFEKGETPFILVLDGVTDVRNFGAICRTASCFGVHAVVVPVKGSATINDFAIKASAGALFHIPVCRVKSLPAAFTFMKESGVRLIACSEKGEHEYFQSELTSPLALIMGAEDRGISPSLLNEVDEILRIPITGPIASLNVGVAAGIALSEIHKQRLNDR